MHLLGPPGNRCPGEGRWTRGFQLTHFNCVQLFVTQWTVAYQAPLSIAFSRPREYWSELPFPSPGDLPNPGIKPASLMSPEESSLLLEPPGKPLLKVQFSHLVVSNPLRPHGLQHARLPCPSPTHRTYSNSCPSSQWCHPTKSSSVIPFSSCFQSFPASGFFPVSQFFTSGDQSIGVSASASVIPMNAQDWILLG